MAVPFTPRFVDLVRTISTSRGTGPLVPGVALPGYSSFAETLSVGDRFYYCVQNSVRPAEREVGRGTLQPDGTISREPVSGPLVDFGTGPKTIALVTAAEWFDKAGRATAPTVFNAADRAAMAATEVQSNLPVLLCEAGREGTFLFQSGDYSALVAADEAEGIFVSPAGESAADGVWVRQFQGTVNVQWFGVLPTNSASENVAALRAALATIKALAVPGGYAKGGLELFFPPDPRPYDFDETIDIPVGIRIRSTGTKMSAGAKLRWITTVTGLRIHSTSTAGASGSGSGLDSSAGCILDGLWIVGNYDGAMSDAEAHGIHCRGHFHIRECMIQYWAGDGIYSVADVVAPIKGNANCSKIDNVWIETVRRGFYCQGGDVNVINVTDISVVGARQWGILDLSFLGNTYVNMHVATSGRQGSMVTHLGRLFQVVPGQEAWASVNPPPSSNSDNQGWLYIDFTGSGGIRAWSNGISLRSGGGFNMGGPNNASRIVNPYVETDCGFSFVSDRVLADQGNANIRNSSGGFGAAVLSANYGTVYAQGSLATLGGNLHSENSVSAKRLNLRAPTGSGGGWITTHGDGFALYMAKAGSAHVFGVDQGPYLFSSDTSGFNVITGVLTVGGSKVLGGRGEAVPDAAALTSSNVGTSAAAPDQNAFNMLVAEFNKLRGDVSATRATLNMALARLRAATGHGLIA